MGGSFRGLCAAGEDIVQRNINSGSFFALANGSGPFLPLFNMLWPIIDQEPASIIDIKILQRIKTA
jgi:hypothetical protein